ncbi:MULTISPECIES: DoxX family protein [unclassified Micromonospora]|uniref:DoxX family protein n=1 Tax=unclassified Micromonospora TaxID=2617518 RepID=UPI002FF194AB
MIETILVIALLGFRLLGAFGVRRFATWAASAAHAMAVMLVVTATAHFVPPSVTVMPNHADLVRMVPPVVPFAGAMVYLTGVLELLGAVGLVLTATRWAAGISLAALYVLLLPANVYAAVNDVPFNGGEPTPLWLRIPQQVLYIAIAVWVARSADRTAARRVLHVRRSGITRSDAVADNPSSS